jgi:type III restriction enzyme
VKFTLHNYQDKAVADVLDALDEARERYVAKSKTSAVSLTAVTGAGKTVMATAVLEALLHGNDQGVEPDPALTVLWLTDDPSLNEQTRRKMLVASELIAPKQLVTIGDDNLLDQKVLDAGTVYFLNIHKLGKGATNYVKTGDRRQYSLWDSIRQTIRERGSSFLLIIDEAHRGTSSGSNGERKSIAAQMIAGDADKGVPPSPVVLGISATPERFKQAVAGSGRLLQPVEVDVDEVRQSGLIKDLVSISFPTETQPGDATLIEQAVTDVRAFDSKWADYTSSRDLAEVDPVLVVQVRSGTSDSELATIVDTILGVWDGLEDKAIGHAFQDHTHLDLNGRAIRYIAPQDIQDDPHLRVVLFKEALTTGWDCPRAEVMVSLRSATDHTYIAQLIGRMVRTPLARRVPASELLNSVSLYLPHFDADGVNQVVTGLRAGEDKLASEITTNPVLCRRNPAIGKEVWELAESLPSYTRPSKTHRNEIARLNAFAQLLAVAGIDKEAPRKAREHVTATCEREAGRLGKWLSNEITQLSKLEYKTRIVTTFESDNPDLVAERARDISDRNVDDLYRQARRRFGDAAATWYWDAVCDEQEEAEGEADAQAAKLKVAALSRDQAAVDAVHKAAAELIASLRKEHNAKIGELSDDDRDRIYQIFQQSREPEQITLQL